MSGKTTLDIWSTIAAWWGAIVGTPAAAFGVYRWWKGEARIRVHATVDLHGKDTHGHHRVIVNITNRGMVGSTLTALSFSSYSGWIQYRLGRPKHTYPVAPAALAGWNQEARVLFIVKLPALIGPGSAWHCSFADEHKLVAQGIKAGIVAIRASMSHQDKPVTRRINAIEGPLFEIVED